MRSATAFCFALSGSGHFRKWTGRSQVLQFAKVGPDKQETNLAKVATHVVDAKQQSPR